MMIIKMSLMKMRMGRKGVAPNVDCSCGDNEVKVRDVKRC